jgi:hypothetical protein
MLWRAALALALLTLLVGIADSASAADLSTRTRAREVGTYGYLDFWGHPYPFGYAWSLDRACTRFEPVETPHGTRTERVWVCDVQRGYANR